MKCANHGASRVHLQPETRDCAGWPHNGFRGSQPGDTERLLDGWPSVLFRKRKRCGHCFVRHGPYAGVVLFLLSGRSSTTSGRRGAFLFFLALLDDFGFSRGSAAASAAGATSSALSETTWLITASPGLIERDIRREGNFEGAHALADHGFGNVNDELFGNIIGQTFDFDFASNDLVDTTLQLDALGIALRDDGDLDRRCAC